MNDVIYTINAVRFPFRKKLHKKKFPVKKLAGLILVCLLAAGFASANDTPAQKQAAGVRQLIKQAEKMTRRGDLPEAEKILREVVGGNPANATAKLALGSNLLKQRRIIEAYELSVEVARSDPKNSRAFAILGATLISAGNFKDAKIASINAVKLNNEEALAWANLGLLDFYENRISQGLDNLRAAVYLEPNEPDFIYSLAQVATRAELYRESADAYNNFLRIAPPADLERRERIKGLIGFLRFLGSKQQLYDLNGAKQTSVSFKLVNDRPVIAIRLEKSGAPLNFVLDTGSAMSVLSEQTARKLNIKPVARGGSARGVGGDGKFNIVYGFLKSIYIGDVKIRNVPVYIRKFHSTNEETDGYIGLSLISKFLTTIDYGEKTFELVSKNIADKTKSDNGNLSLPLRLTSSGFLSGEVELEGIQVPLNFIVDTGASVSVISDDIAETKEISRFIKAEKLRVIGAAGITDAVPTFLLPRITFGTHSRRSINAIALDLDLINESAGFEQAGILGGNFLKNYRLTFDFQNSKVVFIPVK